MTNSSMSPVSARLLALVAVVLTVAVACSSDPNARKRHLLESGNDYAGKRNYSEAIVQYRSAIALDPNFGEAHARLASAYEATRDMPNALREIVRAADLMPDDVETQLRAGRLLIGAAQFPEAQARALKALAKEPKNVNGLIVLGNALAGLKDADGAIEQLEHAIDANPGLTFTYTNLGMLQLNRGNQEAALHAFQRATEVQPKSMDARLNLANFYWATNKLLDAEQELKAAHNIDPDSEAANRMLGVFYLTTGRLPEGEPFLRKYAERTTSVRGKLALADLYLASSRIDEARAILEPLAHSSDRDSVVGGAIRLALIDFQAGRRPDAFAKLDGLLKQFPTNQDALEAQSRFLLAAGRLDEGIKVADQVIAANPKAGTSHYLRGLGLEAKGDSEGAIKSMQAVLEISPSASPAQLELTKLYLGRGEPKAALNYLNPLLRAQPRLAALHLYLGEAYLLSGNLKAAEVELSALASAVPNSAELQTWLGRLYGTKGDNAKARMAFAKALELAPNSLMALNGLVALELTNKNANAVRSALEPRLADQPDSEPLVALAANSYLALGDAEKAEVLFRRVLELNPSNMNAYGRLGGILVAQGRLDQARAEFEQISRQQSKPVAAKTAIGMIYDMQNQRAEAKKAYQEALAYDPRAAVAAHNLALHEMREGNLDVALQLAQTAKAELPGDARVSDTLGSIYYRKGLASLAITAFEESIKQNPQRAETHYHLGLAQLKNGDQRKARQALQEALKLDDNFASATEAKRVLATIKG